jgi:hypothetical protein
MAFCERVIRGTKRYALEEVRHGTYDTVRSLNNTGNVVDHLVFNWEITGERRAAAVKLFNDMVGVN